MQTAAFAGYLPGLPDPDTNAEFYEGVPSRRLAAWGVDFAITLAIALPIGLIFGIVTLGFGFAAFPLIMAATSLIYRTSTIASRSATWGMRFMGIELRRHDGSRFDAITAFLHTLGYIVAMTVFVIQVVSCVTILTTRYRQSVPDLFLRTAMINRPAD
ncbi:RDD family protein [Amaricoccus macauensis]|uniref:RDD family protein n=1 Tax=Amaricoccus macauensis TaxID=57001 RepID=UPI003C7D67D0